MSKEARSWPYDFPQSQDYIPPNQRGIVAGRLLVQDRYIRGGRFLYADSAYVGLALPGPAGSWERESKVSLVIESCISHLGLSILDSIFQLPHISQGYQFWTQADKKGYFVINNVVPGDYNLFAWVPGFIGDYRYNATITITPGTRFTSISFNPYNMT